MGWIEDLLRHVFRMAAWFTRPWTSLHAAWRLAWAGVHPPKVVLAHCHHGGYFLEYLPKYAAFMIANRVRGCLEKPRFQTRRLRFDFGKALPYVRSLT